MLFVTDATIRGTVRMTQCFLLLGLLFSGRPARSQQPSPPIDPATARFVKSLDGSLPPPPQTMPLYEGAIPNSIPGPDEEKSSEMFGETWIEKVSHPAITVFRPARNKAGDTAVIVLPGGGYTGLSWSLEGTRTARSLQEHGVTAVVVKYRMPSDSTMKDKSIGPLQDAQQALRIVRLKAKEWDIQPGKIGVMGFSQADT